MVALGLSWLQCWEGREGQPGLCTGAMAGLQVDHSAGTGQPFIPSMAQGRVLVGAVAGKRGAGEVPGVLCSASPRQPSGKRRHLSGFSLALLHFLSLCSSTPRGFYF